tara:strand:- start:158 stop:334 length:177 start_codon:yes stop_codon:yes gene_type:complete
VKIGDLVKYTCHDGNSFMGYITDSMEDANGFYVYEVVCTDPYDRGWFEDYQLVVISEK